MLFPEPLQPARLLKRYKRFLADVELPGGEVVTAHCPNSGSMLGVAPAGAPVWLSRKKPGGKLAWGWELVEIDGALVGINTGHPNRIVADAVGQGTLPELAGYARLRREVRYGTASRVDLLLEDDDRPPCWVEIKNVHLKRGDRAEFPDSVTSRGARHLEELAREVEAGARAVMVFLVQRGDCARFGVAGDIDPGYASGLAEAMRRGVEAICYDCAVTLDGIGIRRPLPLDL